MSATFRSTGINICTRPIAISAVDTITGAVYTTRTGSFAAIDTSSSWSITWCSWYIYGLAIFACGERTSAGSSGCRQALLESRCTDEDRSGTARALGRHRDARAVGLRTRKRDEKDGIAIFVLVNINFLEATLGLLFVVAMVRVSIIAIAILADAIAMVTLALVAFSGSIVAVIIFAIAVHWATAFGTTTFRTTTFRATAFWATTLWETAFGAIGGTTTLWEATFSRFALALAIRVGSTLAMVNLNMDFFVRTTISIAFFAVTIFTMAFFSVVTLAIVVLAVGIVTEVVLSRLVFARFRRDVAVAIRWMTTLAVIVDGVAVFTRVVFAMVVLAVGTCTIVAGTVVACAIIVCAILVCAVAVRTVAVCAIDIFALIVRTIAVSVFTLVLWAAGLVGLADDDSTLAHVTVRSRIDCRDGRVRNVLLDGGQRLVWIVDRLVVDDRAVAAFARGRTRLGMAVAMLVAMGVFLADGKRDGDFGNRRGNLGRKVGERFHLRRAGIVAHAKLEVGGHDDLDDLNLIVVGLVVGVTSKRRCGQQRGKHSTFHPPRGGIKELVHHSETEAARAVHVVANFEKSV